MKSLTIDDVKNVALDLISKNGSTTNLDIKNELRNQGFYATQTEISEIMDNEHAGWGLTFSFNGMFRTYSTDNGQSSASSSNTSSFGGMNLPGSVSTSPAAPKVRIPVQETNSPVAGDWKVFDAGNPSNILYYLAGPSRNAVRYAFLSGSPVSVKYVDTRAVKVQ